MFVEISKVIGATLALFSASTLAAPLDPAAVAPQKTLFLLAGDSTTAKQSYPDNGGGTFFSSIIVPNSIFAQNLSIDLDSSSANATCIYRLGKWIYKLYIKQCCRISSELGS